MIINSKENKKTIDTETGAELNLVESHISGYYAFRIEIDNTEIQFSAEKKSDLFGSEVLKLAYHIQTINFFGPSDNIDCELIIRKMLKGFKDRYGYREDLVKEATVDVTFSTDCKRKIQKSELR